eukprot:TRINITY_DN8936_c0_g1_i1.p1 TRINITY_DN8936_c0_g1~~TRINITY_DN8936_c0_g1_i1.p1  ORF type:complete len:692 (+),score=126.16 TRINITY_DN8936_c0_g1_i1:138-2213(+)
MLRSLVGSEMCIRDRAEDLGLLHESAGQGRERHMVISRPAQRPRAGLKESSLSFRELHGLADPDPGAEYRQVLAHRVVRVQVDLNPERDSEWDSDDDDPEDWAYPFVTDGSAEGQQSSYEDYDYHTYHLRLQGLDCVLGANQNCSRFKVYNKQGFARYQEHDIQFLGKFPKWRSLGMPHQTHQPNPQLDLLVQQEDALSSAHQLALTSGLSRVAAHNCDYFVAMYQNLIDPNLAVIPSTWDGSPNVWAGTNEISAETVARELISPSDGETSCTADMRWIPTEFKIDRHAGKATVHGPIPRLDREQFKELYTAIPAVLTAGLPLLAKLRRPGILEPDRLQAVVKAQRIVLQPGEQYDGVWHRDGQAENIVAVVLYYSHVDAQLEGGQMEFADIGAEHTWNTDDGCPVQKEDMVAMMKDGSLTVPVKTGTLVVFSNYQLVHRVLRMVNTSERPGSREFVALFVVDQRSPLVPARVVYGLQELYTRTIWRALQQMPARLLQIVLEHTGLVLEERVPFELRKLLLRSHLCPSGVWGVTADGGGRTICSTGNGCSKLVAWLEGDFTTRGDPLDEDDYERYGFRRVQALNYPPPLNRSSSWAAAADQIDECEIEKQADEIFDLVDTNEDDELSGVEVAAFLKSHPEVRSKYDPVGALSWSCLLAKLETGQGLDRMQFRLWFAEHKMCDFLKVGEYSS